MKLGGFSVTLGAVAALALLVVGASGTIAGPTPDSDGDNVKNLVDNCMDVSNPVNTQGIQVDYDRDGYGNQCDGDLNNTGAVNVTDFILFGTAFGSACGWDGSACTDANYNPDADMDASGSIGVTDFVLFGANFLLGTPGPSGLLCATNSDSSAERVARYPIAKERIPCEFLGTYRVKCSGDLIYDENTGVPLRFIIAKKLRPEGLGQEYGHCVYGV